MEQLLSTTGYRRNAFLSAAIVNSRRAVLIPLILFYVFAPCCTRRYFADRGAVVAQLTAHEREYEDLAEEWAKQKWEPGFVFCNFRDGDYRWGRDFLNQDGAGYSVGEGTNDRKKVRTFEDAAKAVGTDPTTLRHWIDSTSRLYIYCIGCRSGNSGVVEIMLKGSDWAPYGYRYAVEGNTDALGALEHYCSVGGMENTDTRIDHIEERWFYFEAKR